MIGDAPNIIIGTLLSEYVGFVDFVVNLFPFVLLATAPLCFFLVWWFKDELVIDESRVKDFSVAVLERTYPIT